MRIFEESTTRILIPLYRSFVLSVLIRSQMCASAKVHNRKFLRRSEVRGHGGVCRGGCSGRYGGGNGGEHGGEHGWWRVVASPHERHDNHHHQTTTITIVVVVDIIITDGARW